MTAQPNPDIVLMLPIPPAANKLRKIDRAGQPAHKRWIEQCHTHVMMQHGGRLYGQKRRPWQIIGKFAIDILLDRGCRYDLDATVKATLDYCVRIDLVPNDSQKYLDDVHLHWGDVPEGMRVTLRAIGGEHG